MFHTSDFYLAITLQASGFIIEEILDADPTRKEFVFKDTEKLRQTVDDYWSGELALDPKKLFSEMKVLKSRMYN